MSDYGLVVYNNSNRIMFDSRREMHSYVVSEIGTGTQPSTYSSGDGDFIFVAIPYNQATAMSSYIIYLAQSFNLADPTPTFKGYDISTGVSDTLTLDYFVVKNSKNISSTDDYGLVINNDDATVQFDSRSVKLGSHFVITSYTQPNSSIGWSPSSGGVGLGDPSDYWDISWTSGNDEQFTVTATGLRIQGGGPYYIDYKDVNSGGFGGGSGEGIGGGFGGSTTTTTSETYGSKNRTMILSAELV